MNRQHCKLSFQGAGFEQLESREMLAGHAMFVAALMAHHSAPPAAIGSAVAGLRSTAGQTTAAPMVLTAQLSNATTVMTARVTYKSCTVNGTTNTGLIVKVEGAAAGSTLDVTLNSVVVGQVTVEANGEGVLSLSSNPKSADQKALPANFSTSVTAGAAINVGTATGTLAVATPTPRGEAGGCHSHGVVTRFTAQLTDSAGAASATATSKTVVTSGVTKSDLKFSVTCAAASSTLDVTIDGTVVGQVTTDATGAGTLKLSSKTSTIPTITAGSTISIGSTLTGSFAAATSSTAAIVARLRHR